VFDYLVEEVFDLQTANTQQFLLQTSILDKFNASLCNAVTEQIDSDQVIRELETANLFLLPLDDQREWYRYHHLFQDFLRIRLEKQDQSNLHLKAIEWLMSNGFAPEAVKHALASGVTETTVQVITQASVEAFNQVAFQTVLGWLDCLPETVVLSHTELAVIKGVSRFLLRSAEEARPYIQAAEGNRIQSTPVTIQGQYFYAKALLALCDNQLNLCIDFAKNALDYLGEDQPVIRNFTMNVLGEVLDTKGEAESAAEYYLQAFEAGWRSGDYLGALVLFTNLILTLNELGRRCEAEDRCKWLAESIEVQSAPESSLLNSIYLPWSLLKYEANQLNLAREYVLIPLSLLKAANFPQGILWGQYILAQVYLAEGKFDFLRKISEEGQKLAAQMGMAEGRGTWFTALEAQADLIKGNLSHALRWVEKTGLSYQDVTNRWNENVYFTYVKILLAHERFTEAEVLLKTMEQSILPTSRNRKIITVNILYSQLLAAQSRHEEANSRMADAVILAAPQDYMRAFLNEGKNIQSLLTQVHFSAPAFVGGLLLTLQGSPDSASQIPGRYESLTEREQEILQMVSKGFSNREIASGLFVSLGTVKKHLNNIFGKLDVKNRTQAVNRGKELGLFK
jgi:LuxR family maltose regulon positive regulatory protein